MAAIYNVAEADTTLAEVIRGRGGEGERDLGGEGGRGVRDAIYPYHPPPTPHHRSATLPGHWLCRLRV